MAGGMAVKEALWVQKLLGGNSGHDPILRLYCDNRSAVKFMNQHTVGESGRTKHIDIQYHVIKERFHRGEILSLLNRQISWLMFLQRHTWSCISRGNREHHGESIGFRLRWCVEIRAKVYLAF
jgi:hypothetical protein